jgi:hypothetical protein
VLSNRTVVAWGDNGWGQTNVPGGLANVAAVAAGQMHSLALRRDGSVVAWGDNTYGQTNLPAGLGNIKAIASGALHAAALKSDGTFVAWGDNSCSQTNLPASLAHIAAIASGGCDNLALLSNAVVSATGDNTFGQTNVPAGLTNVIAIAVGACHMLALGAVRLAIIPPQILAIASLGTSVLTTCSGTAGSAYEIQRSTNLSAWAVLGTTNAPPPGIFQFNDDFSDLGSPPAAAYYRLHVVP